MRVAMVVPFEESVPPIKYGGIELVVANLIDELVADGHSVVLFGTADSKTPAELIPIFPASTRQSPQATNRLSRDAFTYLGISRVLDKINDCGADVVHNHLGWHFNIFQSLINIPIVTTIHLSLEDDDQRLLLDDHQKSHLISISQAQRRDAPGLNYLGNVYNGIKVDQFESSFKPGKYLAFLGSIIPHKGPDLAISIAKQTGQKLLIGAKVDPLQVGYFETKIKPHIDNEQIIFLGELNHQEKNKLLKDAMALLMPIRWNEPFGLVAVEALACGTPVLGLRRGSLPEIIEPGRTGFLCSSVGEMANMVGRLGELDRKACREVAEQRFTANRMAAEYVDFYKLVLDQAKSSTT